MLDKIDEGSEEENIPDPATPPEQLLEVQSKPIYDSFDPDLITTTPQDSDRDGKGVAREIENISKEAGQTCKLDIGSQTLENDPR